MFVWLFNSYMYETFIVGRNCLTEFVTGRNSGWKLLCAEKFPITSERASVVFFQASSMTVYLNGSCIYWMGKEKNKKQKTKRNTFILLWDLYR